MQSVKVLNLKNLVEYAPPRCVNTAFLQIRLCRKLYQVLLFYRDHNRKGSPQPSLTAWASASGVWFLYSRSGVYRRLCRRQLPPVEGPAERAL